MLSIPVDGVSNLTSDAMFGNLALLGTHGTLAVKSCLLLLLGTGLGFLLENALDGALRSAILVLWLPFLVFVWTRYDMAQERFLETSLRRCFAELTDERQVLRMRKILASGLARELRAHGNPHIVELLRDAAAAAAHWKDIAALRARIASMMLKPWDPDPVAQALVFEIYPLAQRVRTVAELVTGAEQFLERWFQIRDCGHPAVLPEVFTILALVSASPFKSQAFQHQVSAIERKALEGVQASSERLRCMASEAQFSATDRTSNDLQMAISIQSSILGATVVPGSCHVFQEHGEMLQHCLTSVVVKTLPSQVEWLEDALATSSTFASPLVQHVGAAKLVLLKGLADSGRLEHALAVARGHLSNLPGDSAAVSVKALLATAEAADALEMDRLRLLQFRFEDSETSLAQAVEVGREMLHLQESALQLLEDIPGASRRMAEHAASLDAVEARLEAVQAARSASDRFLAADRALKIELHTLRRHPSWMDAVASLDSLLAEAAEAGASARAAEAAVDWSARSARSPELGGRARERLQRASALAVALRGMSAAVEGRDVDAMHAAMVTAERCNAPWRFIAAAQRLYVKWTLAADKRSREARECLACLSAFPLRSGIACVKHRHFICRDCLTHQICSDMSTKESGLPRHRHGELQCPGRVDSHRCPEVFPARLLALCCSQDAFDEFLEGKRRLSEHIVTQELQQVHGEQLRQMQHELESLRLEMKRDVDLVIAHHLRQIQELVLTLTCPRCSAAFWDFAGCLALHCHRCHCAFCGLCLQDCGADAHEHVRKCPERSFEYGPADAYFMPITQWQNFQNSRKRRMLQLHLNAKVPPQFHDVICLRLPADFS